MKNLFSVQKKSGQVDANGYILRSAIAFVDRTPDGELLKKQAQMREEVHRVEKAASLPLWLRIAGLIVTGAAALFVGVFFEVWSDTTFAELNKKAPWLLPVMLVCVALAIGYLVLATVRRRKVSASSDARYVLERAQNTIGESYAALGVPADAADTDVMLSALTKRQWENPNSRFGLVYQNQNAKVFREGEAICFAFLDCVVKIPLERIVRIAAVDKRILFQRWNKDVPARQGIYKQYKIRMNNNGVISVKPYYAMELRDGAEEYQILIPCYDIEPVLRMTGKSIG